MSATKRSVVMDRMARLPTVERVFRYQTSEADISVVLEEGASHTGAVRVEYLENFRDGWSWEADFGDGENGRRIVLLGRRE